MANRKSKAEKEFENKIADTMAKMIADATKAEPEQIAASALLGCLACDFAREFLLAKNPEALTTFLKLYSVYSNYFGGAGIVPLGLEGNDK